MDPFDTLPIKMPFKSKELYHYCESKPAISGAYLKYDSLTNASTVHQVGAAFAVASLDPKDDW